MASDDMEKQKRLNEKLLGSEQRAEPPKQNRLLGLFWTLVVAMIGLGTTAITRLASDASVVPLYTQNFIRCFAATVTLGIAMLVNGECMSLQPAMAATCLKFGLSDWFFLWGYVKALQDIAVLQYGAASNALSPLIAATMSYVFLKESLSKYKIFGLVRNILITPLIVNPFADDVEPSKLVWGLVWVAVAGGGTGAMRIVQRSNDAVPGLVLTFWGYALNTLLWLPPGCVPPQLRLTFLWPSLPQDVSWRLLSTPLASWMVMFASGVLGGGLMIAQGVALKHLDVGTYSMIVTPLGLILSTLYDATQQQIGQVVCVGVALQVLALFADTYLEKRAAS